MRTYLDENGLAYLWDKIKDLTGTDRVWVGTTEPPDETYVLWINPDELPNFPTLDEINELIPYDKDTMDALYGKAVRVFGSTTLSPVVNLAANIPNQGYPDKVGDRITGLFMNTATDMAWICAFVISAINDTKVTGTFASVIPLTQYIDTSEFATKEYVEQLIGGIENGSY